MNKKLTNKTRKNIKKIDPKKICKDTLKSKNLIDNMKSKGINIKVLSKNKDFLTKYLDGCVKKIKEAFGA